VRHIVLTLAVAGAAMIGCGKETGTASCTIFTPATGTVCEEHAGLSPPDQVMWSNSCFVSDATADGGVHPSAHFEYAPCAHANALGGCRLNGAPITFWYYADGSYTEADIPALCAQIDATLVAP
jgi:hypothetical protein